MTPSRSKLGRWLVVAVRLVLGGVFIYAAWTKLREPWLLFAMAIDAYGVLPEWAVLAVARALPWAELALGIVLIAGVGLRISATAASLLMLVFFSLMVRSYAQGLAISCGCFGADEAISPRTLARDGLLLVASIFLAAISFRNPRAAA